MEQRIYQGNIDPNALADYLVQTFNQNFSYSGYDSRYTTMAQKVGQGDQILVQIARARSWSGRVRTSLGVSITRAPGGVSVSTGQSNWLNLDDPGIAGSLIGAIFFPPLLIFPLLRGLGNFTFYQDVWDAIDTYCTRAGAHPTSTTTAQGVVCQYCGSINDAGVSQCHTCGAPLSAPQPAQANPTPQAQPSQTSQPSPRPTSSPKATLTQETVTCSRCGAEVPATKYCGNCGSLLTSA